MSEMLIRDPVHDVIAFQTSRPLDALLVRLISAREFQRLRRVRQLGMTNLAYPGADHSRYIHCLGVMETARKFLERVERDAPVSEEGRTLCTVGALLHDLGHGPFSHVFEHVSGLDHERTTRRLVIDQDSQVNRMLADFDRQLPAKLADFLQCRPGSFLNDILCSQLDADRCDYLLRDNLMTGSQYGAYDLRWLLHSLAVDPAGQRLTVSAKGISAVEDYLQARHHMYRNVYFHKTVRSAEVMVRIALHRAAKLAADGELPWPASQQAVQRALAGEDLQPAEFSYLDDASVLECFKTWARCDDRPLASVCGGLLFRRLYKVVDLSHLDEPKARAARRAAEDAVSRAGGVVGYDLLFDEPSDTPYESFSPDGSCTGDAILILESGGQVREFGQISPLVAVLNRQLIFRRLHAREDLVNLVNSAIE